MSHQFETTSGPKEHDWAVCLPDAGDIIAEIEGAPHKRESIANLFATSPEMLLTLEMMLRLIEGEELEERYDGETTILRDIIAQAKGE